MLPSHSGPACCFFLKQKTAYDLRISDWSSDVCSSDLDHGRNVCRRDSIVERRAMPGHGREVAVIPAPGGKASGDSLDQLECLQVLLYVLQAQGRDPGSAVGEHHHKTLRCEPPTSFADRGCGQDQVPAKTPPVQVVPRLTVQPHNRAC